MKTESKSVLPLRYRKRPIVVEAIRYLPGETCEVIAAWMGGGHDDADCKPNAPWIVETLHGETMAEPGDWIVRGPSGDFWPVKPDIFEESYERN